MAEKVRAGITAEQKKDEKGKKRARQQVSELFTTKKNRSLVRAALPGSIGFAYRNQARIPTTDAEKDEL